jgi:hypothetical protein
MITARLGLDHASRVVELGSNPWNLKDEITAQLAYIRGWGGRFVIPIPEVTIVQ